MEELSHNEQFLKHLIVLILLSQYIEVCVNVGCSIFNALPAPAYNVDALAFHDGPGQWVDLGEEAEAPV